MRGSAEDMNHNNILLELSLLNYFHKSKFVMSWCTSSVWLQLLPFIDNMLVWSISRFHRIPCLICRETYYICTMSRLNTRTLNSAFWCYLKIHKWFWNCRDNVESMCGKWCILSLLDIYVRRVLGGERGGEGCMSLNLLVKTKIEHVLLKIKLYCLITDLKKYFISKDVICKMSLYGMSCVWSRWRYEINTDVFGCS